MVGTTTTAIGLNGIGAERRFCGRRWWMQGQETNSTSGSPQHAGGIRLL